MTDVFVEKCFPRVPKIVQITQINSTVCFHFAEQINDDDDDDDVLKM